MDLFVNRRKDAERAERLPTLTYDVPERLRAQVVHIWRRALGQVSERHAAVNQLWRGLHDIIGREIGKLDLGISTYPDDVRCERYLTKHASTDDALIMIEITFRRINSLKRQPGGEHALRGFGITLMPEKAIEELNERLHQNDVGYRFENHTLVQIDSELSYTELVKPTIRLLADPLFKHANDDFMLALEHRRNGKPKDAINSANRAFEATMKAICDKRGWTYVPTDTARRLVTVCREKGLFPDWLGTGLDAFVAMLKTGLPDVRNNQGGHGAPPDAEKVHDDMAGYATHLAASNIILLVNQDRRLG